ncbi:MAG: glycosyltransferase family 39 protein, partial [Chloroflexaceae bacterium]|nr:glycosyltransferase family 39 protein [Chloroflexaceae bacterium]
MQMSPAIPTSRPQPRLRRDGLVLGLLWLGCMLLALAALFARPAADPAAIVGLYRERDLASLYQWTSSQVRVPLRAGTGPTLVELRLNGSRWPGAPTPAVSLSTEAGLIASFAPPERTQRYHVLLPPGQAELLLRSNVAQPPVGDSRWLGVQLHGVEARPYGLPLQAVGESAVLASLATGLLAGWLWAARRGYGLVAGLTLLGLGLRIAFITRAPPGWSQDEVISLVDALHIARTGRDHLGNWLPLGAQEALGDWISPLLTYMELLPVAIFGPQLPVGRMVVALWGAAAVPLTYRVARLLGLPLAGAVLAALVAAISPWQIFLSRFALPPALGPTAWLMLLWAGLHFLHHGTARAALALALAAGVLLHAYPTLKLAVPLFTAWAVGLALLRHGWRTAHHWLAAGLLLGLLWLPFVVSTLFNPASSTRLNQATIRAESPGDWLATWWTNYSAYFQPAFYYSEGDGDPIHGPPGRGQQLPAEAPLALAGLAALAWQLARRHDAEQPLAKAQSPQQSLAKAQSSPRKAEKTHAKAQSLQRNAEEHADETPLCLRAFARASTWLFLGALLLAPLPASLTEPGIHSFRASIAAPVYALVVGMGGALLWKLAGFMRNG